MKELLDDISSAVQRIYKEAVDPVEGKFAYEKRPSEGEISGPPTVLILGNHSSGKSTFINHLLGGDIQKTGLAPTDDAFTILTHGEKDEEFEGKAVVSNPDLPYAGVKHFGDGFLSHFQMKKRPADLLREVTLIDSPGMIDSAKEESGRGYDYLGAVRWFAERADIVLFFFDPDKPGTTGETLQAFNESLHGIDHKLRIVMNKMDRFQSLQDFARAYGALCWNLGKVIPRKDLPLIFTTFVPVDNAPASSLPAEEFEKSRAELIEEIKRAPARRVDNMLTQVNDHAERLQVHSKVIDQTARDLRAFRFKLWSFMVLLIGLGITAGAVSIPLEARWYTTAIIFAVTAIVGYGFFFTIKGLMKSEEKQMIAGLPATFESLYARDLLVQDRAEDVRMLWNVVHPRTRKTLEKLGVLTFPRLKNAEIERLRKAVESEIPDLRSKLHKEMGVAANA